MKDKKEYFGKETDEQLRMIFKVTAIADCCIYLLSVPLYGFLSAVIPGLLIGTAASAVNMILLAYSTVRCVDRGSERRGKRFLFSFYLIRLTIMGIALAVGFSIGSVCGICSFMPLLYPKSMYTFIGIRDHLAYKAAEHKEKLIKK